MSTLRLALVLAALVTSSHAPRAADVLHAFSGRDGLLPNAGLVKGPDGHLYGTTSVGGKTADESGCGAVYRINNQSKFTTVHRFVGKADGCHPASDMINGGDGYLYGTTRSGGQFGAGIVFRMDIQGNLATLASFGSRRNARVPADPIGRLVRLEDGRIFGVTYRGGQNGWGTVYQLSPNGSITVLHAFPNPDNDGECVNPTSGLTLGPNGELYGTSRGGSTRGGCLYSVATNGSFRVRHSFAGSPSDGSLPANDLTFLNGTIYGTTVQGGIENSGTVFSLTQDGQWVIVRSLSSAVEGSVPGAALAPSSQGDLIGSTQVGGPLGRGTVFRVSMDGASTVVRVFPAFAGDGRSPVGQLVELDDGSILGATIEGGIVGCDGNGCGTVYRIEQSP